MGNVENAGIKHKLFENPGEILENVLLQILITADQKLGRYGIFGIHKCPDLEYANFKQILPTSDQLITYQLFCTQKYGHYSIRVCAIYSWNSIQDFLMKNLSLKNSIPKMIEYFLTKHFIKNY